MNTKLYFDHPWKKSWILILLSFVFLFFSCQQKEVEEINQQDAAFFDFVISLDTIILEEHPQLIEAKLKDVDSNQHNQLNYLKGYKLSRSNNKDSALIYFQKIISQDNTEWTHLKSYALLKENTSRLGIISMNHSEKVFQAIKEAESESSMFTYRFYDLFGMIQYNNGNDATAVEYSELYYNSHPFPTNQIVQQRYHDIGFLLNERNKDKKGMIKHFEGARKLALQNNDSLALMRTYKYESKLDVLDSNMTDAIKHMRMFTDYAERVDQKSICLYTNLGKLYQKVGKLDTAQLYFEKAIQWVKVEDPKGDVQSAYKGLSENLAKRGHYERAYKYAALAQKVEHENRLKTRNEQMIEIQSQYKAEKKDKEIEELKTMNQLNRKVIQQDRKIFGVIIFAIFILTLYAYTFFRRRDLQHRNKKLNLENKTLLLEQKLTRMQINPHFIHNSIANLQGLVMSGEKEIANNYLVALSKMIRNVLELNRREFITIREEIENLKNYLQLQEMRLENSFEFQIECQNIDKDHYLIPPMLLQPFAENSIEHGFVNASYKGKLIIKFQVKDNLLYILIDDNGNSPYLRKPNGHKKESLSQIIIQERLDLLFNEKERKAWYLAHQKKKEMGAGYEVHIYLPIVKI